MSDKSKKAVASFLDKVSKTYGKSSNYVVEDPKEINIEKFSTGSLLLDKALKGGYPEGKITEISGDEESGKTTLCIHGAKEFQDKSEDRVVLWVDGEHVFDHVYFEKIGVNIEDKNKFILVKPDTGEDTWNIMVEFARNVKNGLIVLDSVTTLLPSKENEGEVGDSQMGAAARMNSQGLRKIIPLMNKNNITMLAINQTRMKIGVVFGNPETTTGGRGWQFYSRTRLKSGKQKGEDGISSKHTYKLMKSNYGHRDAKVETYIIYGEGIDNITELISLAVEQGIVQKSGSWFSYEDTKLGQGVNGVKEILEDNPELFEEIKSKIDFGN